MHNLERRHSSESSLPLRQFSFQIQSDMQEMLIIVIIIIIIIKLLWIGLFSLLKVTINFLEV